MRLLGSLLLSAMASAAVAKPPQVITDILPVHALVSSVMEGVAEPKLLVSEGADPHHLSLRPSQAAALSEADLLIWIGPELTPWLEKAIGEGRPYLSLLHIEGTLRREFGEGAHSHGPDPLSPITVEGHDHEGHDHEGHDHEGHDHEGHDHGAHGHSHEGLDPHAWLDPVNAGYWLDTIAQALADHDAANAVTYLANAKAARERIKALDQALALELAPLAGKSFVTAHDAYGYFTSHYGLSAAGSLADGDAAAPGAARVKALRDSLGDVACVFPEAGRDAGLLHTVIEGTSVRLGRALDPEGRLVTPGPEAYEALLRGLADSFKDCLAP